VLVKWKSMVGTVANCVYPEHIAVLAGRQNAFGMRSSFVIVKGSESDMYLAKVGMVMVAAGYAGIGSPQSSPELDVCDSLGV